MLERYGGSIKVNGRLVLVGTRVSQLFLLGVTAASVVGAVALHSGMYVIAAVSLVAQSPVFILRRHFSDRKLNDKTKRIPDAQVYSLLGSGQAGITATRLASATNSTLKAAEGKLRELAIEGRLQSNVEFEKYELVYTSIEQY